MLCDVSPGLTPGYPGPPSSHTKALTSLPSWPHLEVGSGSLVINCTSPQLPTEAYMGETWVHPTTPGLCSTA